MNAAGIQMKNVFDLGFSRTDKEIYLDSLPVEGEIPPWLKGTLYRNGPGTFHVGHQSYRHWFDGLAMLHRFQFQKTRVSYANRFLRCDAYNEAAATGKISYSEFATDPCFSIFDRVKNVFSPKLTDSAKVNITKIDEMYLALGETPMQIQFDPSTLESLGVYNYDQTSTRHVTTVHPHVDENGETAYQIITKYGRISQYHILEVNRQQSPRLIARQPVKEPAYIHSFGMSPNYFILTEFPLVVNPLNILLSGRPFIENFRWKPDRGTPFYIFDRKTGKLIDIFDAEPFFAFHHVNAFEEKGKLYVDLVAYPDADIIQAFYLDRIRNRTAVLPGGQFRRYTIDLENHGPLPFETFSQQSIELPRYNADVMSMNGDYRYVYGVSVNRENPFSFYNQLIKLDLKNTTDVIWYKQGCYPGEPLFIRNPGKESEDDGVILSVVLNENKGNSFLLVLDARTFNEIARAEIPHPILFGYHGEFFQ